MNLEERPPCSRCSSVRVGRVFELVVCLGCSRSGVELVESRGRGWFLEVEGCSRGLEGDSRRCRGVLELGRWGRIAFCVAF